MAWTNLCELDELKPGKGKFVQAQGLQLAVFLDQGTVHVVDNHCPHAGGSLSGGYLEDNCVVCPWHHWGFRLDDGRLRDTPRVKIAVYKVRLLPREGQSTLVQADLPGLKQSSDVQASPK